MSTEFIYPQQIDRLLNWPLGTAARLARRRQLPHYLLPDNSIRLRWEEIQALVRRMPLLQPEVNAPAGHTNVRGHCREDARFGAAEGGDV